MNNPSDPIHIPDAADLKPPEPPDQTVTLFTWAAFTASALFVFNLYYYLLLAGRLSRATTPLALFLVLLPEGVAKGALLGAAQWYVLRRIVKSDYRWIVASITGWTFVYLLSFAYLSLAGPQATSSPGGTGALLLFETIRGLLVGACQWLVLRAWGRRAWLWIPVTIVAQIASVLVPALLSAVPLAPAMGWAAFGLVTGLGLVYLISACWPGLLARGQIVEY